MCVPIAFSSATESQNIQADSLSNIVLNDSSAIAFDSVYGFSDVDEKPVLKNKPNSDCGYEGTRINGKVVVQVTVDENGNVIDKQIIKSVKGLDKIVLCAVSELKFSPGKINGMAVKVSLRIPFEFNMDHD